MFIRASTLVFSVVALAGVVTAAPDLEARWNNNQCNSGSIQCCSSVQQSDSSFITGLFGLLGVVLPPPGTQVGVSCTPITVVGTGSGAACTQQTACCTGNTFNSLVTVACTPITINA